jgi:AcrR family transcriptional regulator
MAAKLVDKEEKKNDIMMAAVRLFARKGFEKTTISDIAVEAGIGKGTVYEYFSNKEEMIHQSFHFFLKQMEMDFEDILLTDLPAVEKLKQILQAFGNVINAETEGFVTMMFNFWGEAMRSQDTKNIIFTEMKKFYHSYRKIFADIIIEGMQDGSIRKNINPEGVAIIIIGMLDGVMVQWLMDRDVIDYKEILNTLISLILKGIAHES